MCVHVCLLFFPTSYSGFVLIKFDIFWIAEKPANIMAFPEVKQKFLQQLKENLNQGKLAMTLAK